MVWSQVNEETTPEALVIEPVHRGVVFVLPVGEATTDTVPVVG